MPKDFRIIVLISGRGSNLKSLIAHQESFSIAGVLSNKPEAAGLAIARAAGVPCYPFNRADYPDLAAMKSTILRQAQALNPDLLVLAGFMQILESEFINAFPGKIINIHPSLLPAFPGIDTHARAIAAKEKIHGCTVHVVDAGVDTGPIIAQASCECREGEEVDALAARVLSLEHRLLPWVVTNIARGNITIGKDGIVTFSPLAREEASMKNFSIPD